MATIRGLYTVSTHRKPLTSLCFHGRNCRGRIERLARVIEVETVGDLLEWASDNPRGLEQILEYPNIGRGTLQVLRSALEREGIQRIPESIHVH